MQHRRRLLQYAVLITLTISFLVAAGPVAAQLVHSTTGGAFQGPEFYPGCSSIGDVGHFRLVFGGVQYDYARNESFWLYVLEWDGVAPAMDELIIGTGDCIVRATIITACPAGYSISVDGSTGIYGIKWTAQPSIEKLHISFLVKGIYDVGPVPFAVKAGGATHRGTICGVICEEDCELSIVCPPDTTVDCTESTDPPGTGVATADGNCPPIEVTYSDVEIPGICPQEKTIERTWRAEDASGLVRTCVQIINVVDDDPPVLTCAINKTLGCNEEIVFTQPKVSDNCDPNPTVVELGPYVVMGPGPCQVTHTMCWYAYDACGNQSEQCCQSITVTIDTEPPVVTPGPDITLGCNEEVVFTQPEVTDNCDPNPTVEELGPYVVMGPGPCQVTHTMCWRATDWCENQSEQACQSITVTLDEAPPTLTCGADKRILCTEPVVFDEPEASDNCDPSPTVTIISDETTAGPGPGEITHTRCWVAEDYCRNVSEPCCQVIVQVDEEPPVIICDPDGRVGCNDPIVFTLPEVTDNCDTDPEIVEIFFQITPGPGPCDETHTKGWIAVDDAGNESTPCYQSISRMVDTIPPVLVAAPDDQVLCNQDPIFTPPEVSDNCDEDPVVEIVSETVTPGPNECDFIYTRCWRATDDCGNVSETVCQQITGKRDTVSPILTCQPDKTIPWGAPVIFDDPDVWDNCPDMPPLGEGSEVVNTVLDDGRQTFEKCWITFDPCGNVSNECCQVITMEAEPDPYCTFGCWDWASACLSDENYEISTFPACVRDEYFDMVFFQGVLIGLEEPPYHSAYWSSAQALEAFECSYGIPKALDRDYVDPIRIELRGVLVGELLALTLNRGFSCAGYFSTFGYTAPTSCYGQYVIPEDVPKFAGLTVDQFLVVGNRAVGGDTGALTPYGANLMELWQAACFLNWRFSDCGGRLARTASPPELPMDPTEETPDDDPEVLSAGPSRLRLNVQPNPLQGSTTIELDLPMNGYVQVGIYDIQGRKIASLIDGHKQAGSYSADWNGDDVKGMTVASGVYFCRVRVGTATVLMEKLIKY